MDKLNANGVGYIKKTKIYSALKGAGKGIRKPKHTKRLWVFIIAILMALNAYLMADLYRDLTARLDRTNYQTDILIDQYNILIKKHDTSSNIHR